MQKTPYSQIPPRVAALLRAPILAFEGGYVNRSDDHGGPTNHGVTLATLRAWRGVPTLTAADVRAVTIEEAVEIAYNLFYRGLGFDQLPVCRTAAVYLDWCWGSPQRKVIKRMQRQIGLPETAIDGRIGPATAAAFAAYLDRVGDAAAVVIASDLRCRYYLPRDRRGRSEPGDVPQRLAAACRVGPDPAPAAALSAAARRRHRHRFHPPAAGRLFRVLKEAIVSTGSFGTLRARLREPSTMLGIGAAIGAGVGWWHGVVPAETALPLIAGGVSAIFMPEGRPAAEAAAREAIAAAQGRPSPRRPD